MLSGNMMSVEFLCYYAECHYADCRNAECASAFLSSFSAFQIELTNFFLANAFNHSTSRAFIIKHNTRVMYSKWTNTNNKLVLQ